MDLEARGSKASVLLFLLRGCVFALALELDEDWAWVAVDDFGKQSVGGCTATHPRHFTNQPSVSFSNVADRVFYRQFKRLSHVAILS